MRLGGNAQKEDILYYRIIHEEYKENEHHIL